MVIDDTMVEKMKHGDVYIKHRNRVFVRLAGMESNYLCKYPGEKPFTIDRKSTAVTDALIFGEEIKQEDYDRF